MGERHGQQRRTGNFRVASVIQGGVAAGVALATRGVVGRGCQGARPPDPEDHSFHRREIAGGGRGHQCLRRQLADELAELKRVLQGLPELGGKVVDTARQYGSSEEVIGKLLAEIGNRDKFFLATKTPMSRRAWPAARRCWMNPSAACR